MPRQRSSIFARARARLAAAAARVRKPVQDALHGGRPTPILCDDLTADRDPAKEDPLSLSPGAAPSANSSPENPPAVAAAARLGGGDAPGAPTQARLATIPEDCRLADKPSTADSTGDTISQLAAHLAAHFHNTAMLGKPEDDVAWWTWCATLVRDAGAAAAAPAPS